MEEVLEVWARNSGGERRAYYGLVSTFALALVEGGMQVPTGKGRGVCI